MPTKAEAENFGPWNPGLESSIPDRLMPRATLFDPANASVSWDDAKGLAKITGLKPQELAVFRPERLALHHVLIRVTGQLHVPDGPAYADLGINLRSMAADIFAANVAPNMDAIVTAHGQAMGAARTRIEAELAAVFASPPAPRRGFLDRMLGRGGSASPATREDRAHAAVRDWGAKSEAPGAEGAAARALARVVGAILAARGGLMVDAGVIVRVALGLVSNTYGSDVVGDAVDPLFDQGALRLDLYPLPPQPEPVVLNVKGASAAGKSSIRSDQRRIAKDLGLDWRDFAIISPDYWRKALIDYGGLGQDYKYAAMLTGHELEVIDRKLDALMARNAARGHVPHMLIDRFRFDSFQTATERQSDSKLLTRFGSRVYLFFMVTPPEETVVRAWNRGLTTGRYKAVDDLLFHNIEAYAGMPELFFNWALVREKWVHYEFLDNSVPQGQPPRTIAFGDNGRLVIRDLDALCNIVRYRHVNVDARDPGTVINRTIDQSEALEFVRQCCSRLDRVDFVTGEADQIYATAEGRRVVYHAAKTPDAGLMRLIGGVETEDSLGGLDPDLSAGTIGV